MKKKKFKIILEKGIEQLPYKHEMNAASIIADYFESDVTFLRKNPMSSPDLLIIEHNQIWELKSPLGGGKRTIANNLREASRQSQKVILDLSRCKMNNEKALSRVREFLENGNTNIKKLLIIGKNKKVLVFLNKKR